MKAPDEIYFSPKFDIPQREKECSDDIEYIRKDALLEWAKEHYTGLDITKRDMWDGGYNCAMKQLIEKLESL